MEWVLSRQILMIKRHHCPKRSSMNSDKVPQQLIPHQSLRDIPSSCQGFEMPAVIDQLHLF